jgi:hypothetical protein
VIIALGAGALGVHGGCSNSPAAQAAAPLGNAAPATPEPPAAPPPYDELLTDQARVLAGMMPQVAGRFSNVTGDAVWQAYRAEFDHTWSHSEAERFHAMRTWRDGELRGTLSGPCDTLFYPFSGPDIVNAWVLFPECNRYVMFGLEHTGSFPKLEGMNPARVDRLLGNVRHVVADLFERNYFITRQMMADLETPELEGTLPVVALLLARLGSTLTAVTPLELTPDGTFVTPRPGLAASRANLPAVRIDTLSPTGMRQQILYFRMQADDAPMAKHPGMGLFFGSLRPYRTLIKSASYLMHGPGFTRIRGELLAGSSSILQDDTGIPFALLNTPEWDVRLYGKYAKPVKDFGYAEQPDLAAAFAEPGRARPLPFTWGYHWRSGISHMMLATRRETAQAK